MKVIGLNIVVTALFLIKCETTMNVVKLQGSIAEQMFQYAFYMALQRRDPEARLHVPEQWLRSHFRLDRYLLAEEADLKYYGKGGWKNRFVAKFKKPEGIVYVEKDNAYKPELLEVADTYLEGRWLSPRYFEDFAQEVREMYTVPAKKLPASSFELIKMLTRPDVVSVHVYNPESKESTCTPDYYNWAIANVIASVGHKPFYVFTTDVEWAKQKLEFQGAPVEMIAYPAEKELKVMPYLCMANHNILANTLASWWAGWLNAHDDKIVIAPERWLPDGKVPDLIPQGWTTIPTT